MKQQLEYYTKQCANLEDKVLKQCSDLFSNHYGVYSGKDGKHTKGQQIKLGIRYYQHIKENPNMYVSLCYKGDELIGQAFFLKKEISTGEKCTWVTQLLVHRYYRGKGIATKLLHSAWGFSDYFAWGLATANAVTIKTLESVTWREVSPLIIEENIDVISQLCNDIPFAKEKLWRVESHHSQIFTNFFPEQEKASTELGEVYVEKVGKLEDGYEWLAFTFRTQDMTADEKHLEALLDFSAAQLDDAYSRMDMQNQGWTRYTQHEIDFVMQATGIKEGMRVLDMGCGQGRHTMELAKQGMQVTAIDSSSRLIDTAIRNTLSLLPPKQIDAINFQVCDARKPKRITGKYDAVICLYDVIGSYRNREDNLALLDTISNKLKKGARAIFSVMSMELTQAIAKNVSSIRQNPQALLQLKAANIMQSTGDIFNPDYFVLDPTTSLVYRKEQFENDGQLSAEYVIADYRFTRAQLTEACEERGLKVIKAQHVRIGNWFEACPCTDTRAKEILFVVEKA